ncbi:MAG TPA: Ppx/GppA phosphatase family protein, partial [Vicinamibacteria bacterium]|nr:Ppx/GppA phosphatase family protein [Vicinamibacteria bacterium]
RRPLMARKHTLPQPTPAPPAPPSPAEPARPIAVLDMGASAVRLVVAEAPPDGPPHVLEEVSRGVLLGKDTFTHGRLGAATIEATLKALEGFRRIMDTYGVLRYRAVATSAVREATNADAFLDRVRLRTGLDVEVIDGSEENRLTYVAVRERLAQHPALVDGDALLIEVGGGSADISFLRKGQPSHSGTFPLGSIRMRQNLGNWQGSHEQGTRLLVRHIHNVVEDIRREMPLKEARHFIALGGDLRFAAAQVVGEAPAGEAPVIDRDAFIRFVDSLVGFDADQLVEKYRLPQAQAETLVPALLAYRELLIETSADRVIAPDSSLRSGLLLELSRSDEPQGIEDFRKQVLSSAAALGERYRYDAAHARNTADLAVRLFEQLRTEHGLSDRHRLLLEVAALLHDIGNYVNIRGHHKHSQYLIAASEIFGLSQDDMLLVSNVARYHRRAVPSKSHLTYMALDREARVATNKLSAILRLANALDADHLQKVKDVRVITEDADWVLEVEGAGDLTMERLATLARADYLTEVFGRKVTFRESRPRQWP